MSCAVSMTPGLIVVVVHAVYAREVEKEVVVMHVHEAEKEGVVVHQVQRATMSQLSYPRIPPNHVVGRQNTQKQPRGLVPLMAKNELRVVRMKH